MNKINVAIIGCGTVHGTHIKALEKIDHVQLYAICDKKEEILKVLAEKYQCKYYTDFEEMLEDEKIDAVHICTPHYLHKPMILKALAKGKHVFTEKPLALNQEECKEIEEAVKVNSKKVSICLQNRLNPTSIKMKEIIDSGELGLMKGIRGFVSWYRNEEYYTKTDWRGRKVYEGGGLLMNQMIHTVDLMQWFCGGIEKLRAHVSTRLLEDVIDEEDTAEATFWMNNGVVGHFYATNCYTMDSSVLIEAHLEKGILRIQDNQLICKKDGETRVVITDASSVGGKSYWGSSHEIAINKFYKAIRENTDDYIHVSEGSISVDICQSIYKSSEEQDNTIILKNK